MADQMHNVGLGRFAQWAINVDTNSPTNSALIMSVWFNDGSSTDDQIKDADTVAAIEALAGVTERTANGWQRRTLVDSDVTVTIDDTNNRTDVDIPDQTYTAVTTDNSTDIGVAYDDDTTAGTDANILPGTWHDFAVTADGSDVTAQIATAGIYRAQ